MGLRVSRDPGGTWLSFRWLLWSLASPSQVLLALVVAGILLTLVIRHRAGPASRGARIGAALTLVGGAGLALFGFLPVSHYSTHLLESRFPIPEPLADVAGIILLAGSERPGASDAFGEPQLGEQGSRYITALRLANRFPNAQLIYTGGSRSAPGKGPLGTQSAVATAILESVGLDPARIVYELESGDSCDHPRNVRALVQPAAGEHWVVVTTAMHMPRVVACFRAAGWPEIIPYPTDFKVELGSWDISTFQVVDNLRLLDASMHEWVGLLYYRLTGRIQELFPAP